MKNEKKRNKHKYSSGALVIFLGILVIGSVAALDLRELDAACASNSSYCYVPYTGATDNVSLGGNIIIMDNINIENSVSGNTVNAASLTTVVGIQNTLNGINNYVYGLGNICKKMACFSFGVSNIQYTGSGLDGQGAVIFGSGNKNKAYNSYLFGTNNDAGMASNGSSTIVSIGNNIDSDGDNIIGIGSNLNLGANNSENILGLGFSYTNTINNSIGLGIDNEEYVLHTNDTAYMRHALVVGDNTNDNLTDGDINASILYIDAITYKSPAFVCSGDWCEIRFPQYRDSLYIHVSRESWDILEIVYKETSYTPAQFNNGPCNTNQNTRNICDALIDKILNFQAKKQIDADKKACRAQGEFFYYKNGQCHFNAKADCEKTRYHVFIQGQCYENLYLKCVNTPQGVWDFSANTCTIVVPLPVPPRPMTAQECYSDPTQKWTGTQCVGLET